jgi:hypothetical protein
VTSVPENVGNAAMGYIYIMLGCSSTVPLLGYTYVYIYINLAEYLFINMVIKRYNTLVEYPNFGGYNPICLDMKICPFNHPGCTSPGTGDRYIQQQPIMGMDNGYLVGLDLY